MTNFISCFLIALSAATYALAGDFSSATDSLKTPNPHVVHESDKCTLFTPPNGEPICVQDPCPQACQVVLDFQEEGGVVYSCRPCNSQLMESDPCRFVIPTGTGDGFLYCNA